jgi:hypothetical protein
MKTRNFIIAVFLMVSTIFILNSCNKETINDELNSQNPVLKSGSIPTVNGQGTVLWTAPEYPEGVKRHFTLHATLMPDGSVRGNGVLHFIGGERDIKFDITCMYIKGNTATLSGIITHSSVPEYDGTYCYVRVVDNGEGENEVSDQITLFYVGESFPVNCAIVPNYLLHEIEDGNIQVCPSRPAM